MTRRRYSSITKKCILLLLAIGIIVILIVGLVFPPIFYAFMKPYFSNHVSQLINGGAVRQSYMSTNYRAAYSLSRNTGFQNAMKEFYRQDDHNASLREEIIAHLPVQRYGPTHEPGAILIPSYIVVATVEGDLFYEPDLSGYARILEDSDWYQNIQAEGIQTRYSPVLHGEIDGNPIDVMCLVIQIKLEDRFCYAFTITDFQDFKGNYHALEEIGIQDYSFICSGEVLYSNLGEQSEIPLADYPDYMYEGAQYEAVRYDQPNAMDFMALCTYSHEDFRIAVHVPRDVLLSPYSSIFQMFQFFFILIVLLIVMLVMITLRQLLKRLTNLSRQMNAVRTGNYDIQIKEEKNDEIGDLAQTFNMMLATIKEDFSQKVQHEKQVQQMQYSLMVSAIDPHFIYNTLNTITVLAKMGRSEEVVEVNVALIGTLKDRLRMKTYKTFDTVRAEKQVLEQYMVIQRYLCHNTIQFTFEASAQDLELKIPKNIIQPLVENSIKHGLLPHKGKDRMILEGKIDVKVVGTEKNISIVVSDNGIGMDELVIQKYFTEYRKKELDSEDCMEHIGIRNVGMRLAYLYGDKFQFTVRSMYDQGTTITIIFPKEKNEDF